MRVVATAARLGDGVATAALDDRTTGGAAAGGSALVAGWHALASRDRPRAGRQPRGRDPLEGAAPGGRAARPAAPCTAGRAVLSGAAAVAAAPPPPGARRPPRWLRHPALGAAAGPA